MAGASVGGSGQTAKQPTADSERASGLRACTARQWTNCLTTVGGGQTGISVLAQLKVGAPANESYSWAALEPL